MTSSGRPTSTRGLRADRIQWQFEQPIGNAEVWISSKIAWQMQRHVGRYGEFSGRPTTASGSIFTTLGTPTPAS